MVNGHTGHAKSDGTRRHRGRRRAVKDVDAPARRGRRRAEDNQAVGGQHIALAQLCGNHAAHNHLKPRQVHIGRGPVAHLKPLEVGVGLFGGQEHDLGDLSEGRHARGAGAVHIAGGSDEAEIEALGRKAPARRRGGRRPVAPRLELRRGLERGRDAAREVDLRNGRGTGEQREGIGRSQLREGIADKGRDDVADDGCAAREHAVVARADGLRRADEEGLRAGTDRQTAEVERARGDVLHLEPGAARRPREARLGDDEFAGRNRRDRELAEAGNADAADERAVLIGERGIVITTAVNTDALADRDGLIARAVGLGEGWAGHLEAGVVREAGAIRADSAALRAIDGAGRVVAGACGGVAGTDAVVEPEHRAAVAAVCRGSVAAHVGATVNRLAGRVGTLAAGERTVGLRPLVVAVAQQAEARRAKDHRGVANAEVGRRRIAAHAEAEIGDFAGARKAETALGRAVLEGLRVEAVAGDAASRQRIGDG